jgi:hypothetical protein
MGLKKNWDLALIAKHINIARLECRAVQNDGSTQWMARKDLYKIKWIVEDALRDSPCFSIEKDWLKEQEQKKIIDILREDYNP